MDCYLQIRRAKTTIFTDVTEHTTVSELKQILSGILFLNPDAIRLTCKGQTLDIDSKHLVEYGITSKDARPQNPMQLEYTLQSDDSSSQSIEVVPYSYENSSSLE